MSTLKRSLAITAAVGAVLVAAAGVASADDDARGLAAAVPGLLSNNLGLQPNALPINMCAPQPSYITLLSPSYGGSCVNVSKNNGNAVVGRH
ncbi:chaplin family protein [Streptomyces sp. NPDC046977]|uniref:chaplin family protein n=1 Tax=Streptomyces sp. NPDC046977 TaxID=3154703 RepID=UPI00340977F5